MANSDLNIKTPKHKVGIVLSGGGALGFAHIGVLKVLEEHNICPKIISGTSIGSLIGVFYANGYSARQIYDIIKHERLEKPLNIIYPNIKPSKYGFSSNRYIHALLKKYIKHDSFEQLNLPLHIAVTNLTKGKMEYVSKGNSLFPFVLASAAIPTIFETVELNSEIYVDGGVMNNLPALPIRKQCRHLIGVNVKCVAKNFKPKSIRDVLMRSLSLTIEENSKLSKTMCDVLIEPKFNSKYDEFSFKNFDDIYELGYNTAKKYLEKNPKIEKRLAGTPKI